MESKDYLIMFLSVALLILAVYLTKYQGLFGRKYVFDILFN